MTKQRLDRLEEEERRAFIEIAEGIRKGINETKVAVEDIIVRLAERRSAVTLLKSAASTLRRLENAWETVIACLSREEELYSKCVARIEEHKDHCVVRADTPVPISLKLKKNEELELAIGDIIIKIVDMFEDFLLETARGVAQAVRAVNAIMTELKLTIDSVREMHERVLLLEKRLRELEENARRLGKSG